MNQIVVKEYKIPVFKSGESVTALLTIPKNPLALFVCAHGAGTDMRHRFLEKFSLQTAQNEIACLRYNFIYTEKKQKKPDPRKQLLSTVRSAIEFAANICPGVPMFAGGKSMGGRMTSNAVAEGPVQNIKGLIFLGFPLHPAGEPSIERADHLFRVSEPMLFLQGTRDALADLKLLEPVVEKLKPRATLLLLESADHSFHVLKRSGRNDDEIMDEAVSKLRFWIKENI